MWGNLWVPGPTQRSDGCTVRCWESFRSGLTWQAISEVGRPADPYGILDGSSCMTGIETSITQSSGTEHCYTRFPSTREHYKEVSSPHIHTRWRQRRTTRHPSPTHRGHHRNCVLCRPDIFRWCGAHRIKGIGRSVYPVKHHWNTR